MADHRQNNRKYTPIFVRDIDGYRVHILDDGADYEGLIRGFIRGEIDSKRLGNPGKHRRTAHLAERNGRKYVIKFDPHPGNEWCQRLWQIFVGPRDSRLMRRINRAVDGGCDVAPRTLLVAERIRCRLVTETLVVHEYIEGRPLDMKNLSASVMHGVAAAMEELYSHRLAHTDISPGNFLVTAAGVKVIDITFRGTFLMGRIKGMVRLKHRFGIDMPLKSGFERILFRVAERKEAWNGFWRIMGWRLRAFFHRG